jgi:iron complex outermembrane recepter protein
MITHHDWGRPNFIVGAFYQDREQNFDTDQAATGTLLGLQILDDLGANPFPFVADPVTGYTFEWSKEHPTSARALSFFTSGTFQITDRLDVTAGVRWTDEERESRFLVPFMHTAFVLQGFVPSGFDSGKIKFEDDNISPEVSLLYALNNDVNLFAAYKTGFKSGGIDNSSLPTPSTTTAFSNGDFSEVLYDSETGEGFELGVKSNLLENTLNINATVYRYVFEDLQIQQFDGAAIAFKTFNAGELENYGFEIDGLWLTSINGLTLRGALAYTKTEYSDTAINQGGADLNGETRQNTPEIATNLGFDYSFELGNSGLEMGIYGTGYYSGSYYTSDAGADANGDLDRFKQDSFLTIDAGVFIGSINEKWRLSLIGRNITDEVYFTESTPRPLTNSAEDPLGRGDLGVFANRGRTITLRADYTF